MFFICASPILNLFLFIYYFCSIANIEYFPLKNDFFSSFFRALKYYSWPKRACITKETSFHKFLHSYMYDDHYYNNKSNNTLHYTHWDISAVEKFSSQRFSSFENSSYHFSATMIWWWKEKNTEKKKEWARKWVEIVCENTCRST